ncbi:Cell surface superoxide dismutase [Cu-Zn] 4 [Emydomyces testavorans]|uniref:superoxide dismutase n=1 Tax=Emydomyces testavorans TaxID=2070801 RepID=A0AAF0DCX9_9EURO|nr:Cell surface superoxide dismutase [Cu-Zn] 4 [Emydomyces testavorans]
MYCKALLACSLLSAGYVAAQTTGKLGDAEVTTCNPSDTVYEATLLNKKNTNIRGTVLVTGASEGRGVIFNVDFTGFPEEGGPFIYHVHDQPVPEDGNCTKTLAHLDPYIRGEVPPCNSSKPETCQTGDLSGKYGSIQGVKGDAHYKQTYHDLYSSTKPGLGSFVGNRSIVVHYANKTRANCGNFVLKSANSGNKSPCRNGPCSTGTLGTGGMPRPTSPPIFEGDASKVSALSTAGILVAMIGFLW